MKIYSKDAESGRMIQQNSLLEAIGFQNFLPGSAVCIVGAGGKTTLCYRLAMEAGSGTVCENDRKIMITTTTHMTKDPQYGCILGPEISSKGNEYEEHWADDLPWKNAPYLVLGRDAGTEGRPGKICALPDRLRESIKKKISLTIVEGDGARRLPFKIPGKSEPVIPEETDIVLVSAGLSALGKRIADCSFRSRELAEFLKKDEEDSLTEEDMALILEEKYLKYIRKQYPHTAVYCVLNQADNEELVRKAERIAELLEEKRILITFYEEYERNQL